MDRLTKTYADDTFGVANNLPVGENSRAFKELLINKVGTYENTGLTPAEVTELAQAKADGRIVVLPCKVGDTVYETRSCFSAFKEPKAQIVQGFSKWANQETILLCESGARISVFKIGKTVFLTKPEAQAALDRMEK